MFRAWKKGASSEAPIPSSLSNMSRYWLPAALMASWMLRLCCLCHDIIMAADVAQQGLGVGWVSVGISPLTSARVGFEAIFLGCFCWKMTYADLRQCFCQARTCCCSELLAFIRIMEKVYSIES